MIDQAHKEALRASLDAAIRSYSDFAYATISKTTAPFITKRQDDYEKHLDSVVDIIAGDL